MPKQKYTFGCRFLFTVKPIHFHTVGEVTSALLSKCGKPMMVEPITKSTRSTTGELTQISTGERWTYKQGVGKFLRIVIVNNGVVVSIENGPRQ